LFIGLEPAWILGWRGAILPFSGFALPFSGFVCLFPGVIQNLPLFFLGRFAKTAVKLQRQKYPEDGRNDKQNRFTAQRRRL
jgi:hypothetical protein